MSGRKMNNPNQYSEEQLRNIVIQELTNSGWRFENDQFIPPIATNKQDIRNSHKYQRLERASGESKLLNKFRGNLLKEFAEGNEIDPFHFQPELIEVDSKSPDNNLFRFATFLWSVPVSHGYGRRMRYIIRDAYNGKLMGIFALMDPVFNLKVRDKVIGWNSNQRKNRLYNMMDAYILGAMPPYNYLLGGKMVALSTVSDQIRQAFHRKYSGTLPVWGKKEKDASLVLITTTSALGRSSIYNRIQLPGERCKVFQSMGYSGGWGHFHISDNTFNLLRDWLRGQGDTYADKHQYGDGPNWRLRTIRQAFDKLGFIGDSLKHGIQREVFLAPLAINFAEFLRGETNTPFYLSRDIQDLALYFRDRWMIPRSSRNAEWCNWRREDTWDRIAANLDLHPINGQQYSLF